MENKNLSEVIREFRITATDGKNDFSEANIKNFRQFYLTFPSDKILSAPRRELAWSICSTHHIQQGIEKRQQAVGQISSQALLQLEKPIAKQAATQLVPIPLGQNITKNLRDCNE